MKNKILTLGFVFFILFIVFVSPIEFKDSIGGFSSSFVYGYGGGGGPTTYDVESNLDDPGDSIEKSLGKDYGIKFKLDGKSHTIKVEKIYANSVKLKIASDTFYVKIDLDETQKVDINSNGYYDMALTLKSLTETRAKVKFEILPDTEKVEAEDKKDKWPEAEAVCEENWQCTEWSECADEKQTRECIDFNECSTTENKPAEEQGCVKEGMPLTGKAITPIKAPIAGIVILIVVCLVAIIVVLLKHRKHKRRLSGYHNYH